MKEQELQEFYKDYMNNMSVKDICNKYNMSSNSKIYKIIKEFNLKKRENPRNIKNVNHNFFDEINEIQAYLLGFYLGDGSLYITGNSYNIKIGVKYTDIYIINLFKKYISPESNIQTKKSSLFKSVNNKWYTGNEQKLISFTSTKIGKYLQDLGFGKNKTNLFKFLPDFSNENKIHFLRGYFDADGCIMVKLRKEGWINRRFQLTSYDRNILDDLVLFLDNNNINSKVYSERNHFHLLVQKKTEIIKLYKLLYNNCNFFFERKKRYF